MKGHNSRRSKYKWSDTKPFPKKWIKIWRAIINTYIVPRLQTSPLGAWTSPSHQEWLALFSDDGEHVYYDNSWCKKFTTRRSATLLPTATIATKSYLADVTIKNGTLCLLAFSSFPVSDSLPLPPLSAWEMFQNAPHWQREILAIAEITEEVI